jgi:pyruvate/2-oxoglutarate dehydrogenase complex dihydrolipoamide dehydrogenase (E3) component
MLRVAVFDYIKPTPHGITWGLGGTCVNVGCIPKKLMHHTGLLGKSMSDSSLMGWRLPTGDGKEDTWAKQAKLNWPEMVEQVDLYIKSLNFNYVKSLREAKVDYINAYAVCFYLRVTVSHR